MIIPIRVFCILCMVLLLPINILSAAQTDLRLLEAARKQDKEGVRSLLQEKMDVNATEPDGATALHWAAHRNDLEIAELLIRAGANVNAVNDYGVTPLYLACTNASSPMLEKLLNGGANPNVVLPSGETPLMTCSWTGSPDAVRLLLARGADVNARETRRGQTALMWALEQKHLEVTRALIEGEADVGARSKSGFTPLLFAAKQGELESVRILLAAGANVNEGTPVRNLPGGPRRTSVPDRPANSPSPSRSENLNYANPSPPDQAQRPNDDNNDPEPVDADVPVGMTPLLMATASGHQDLSLFLLENGADANAADGTGATALHHAMLKGMALIGAVSTSLAVNDYVFRPNMLRLIESLLVRGADPNARMVRDPRLPGTTPRFSLIGATPFMFATASGDIGLMRLLMKSGANPLAATNQNTTMLMVAAGLGNNEDPTEDRKKTALEAAQILLESGADVNAVGENGWTALHGAAYTGADAMTQLLVERGAKLDVKDVFGQTPYSIAMGQIGAHIVEFQKKPFGPHPSTANLLRKLGADPLAAEVLEHSEGVLVNPTQPRR